MQVTYQQEVVPGPRDPILAREDSLHIAGQHAIEHSIQQQQPHHLGQGEVIIYGDRLKQVAPLHSCAYGCRWRRTQKHNSSKQKYNTHKSHGNACKKLKVWHIQGMSAETW